jgi:hypothetical protein
LFKWHLLHMLCSITFFLHPYMDFTAIRSMILTFWPLSRCLHIYSHSQSLHLSVLFFVHGHLLFLNYLFSCIMYLHVWFLSSIVHYLSFLTRIQVPWDQGPFQLYLLLHSQFLRTALHKVLNEYLLNKYISG